MVNNWLALVVAISLFKNTLYLQIDKVNLKITIYLQV